MNDMIADRTRTIMQGTTPSLTITISENDFLLSNVSEIDFRTCSGANWKKIVSYTMDDLIIDTENNTLTKKFDAQETANFSGRHQQDHVRRGRYDWSGEGWLSTGQ